MKDKKTLAVTLVGMCSITSAASAALVAQIDFNTTDGTQTTNNLDATSPTLGNPNSIDTNHTASGTGSFSTDDPAVHGTGGASRLYATAGTNGGDGVLWTEANPNNGLWNGMTQATFTAWIKPSTILTSGNAIWNANAGGGGDGYKLQVVNVDTTGTAPDYRLQARFKFNNNGSFQTLTSTSGISLNTWQFVALTLDVTGAGTVASPDVMNLYVGDGTTISAVGSYASTASNLTSVRDSAEGLSFGGGLRSNVGFAGLLDNGRFYNAETLTASELTTVMRYNDMIPEPSALAAISLLSPLALRRRSA